MGFFRVSSQVETAGDCYIVSAGIMSTKQSDGFGLVVEDGQDPQESARRVLEFSKAILDAAKQVLGAQYNLGASLGASFALTHPFPTYNFGHYPHLIVEQLTLLG